MDDDFIIQDIPGKGKGVIAARAISSGDLVLLESPLFTMTLSRTNTKILTAVSALTDSQQRQFFALANSLRGKLPPALGTFNTNVLPCGYNSNTTGHAATEGGIFVIGSRFNSSCVPNINNYWDEQLRQISFRAVRDIVAGEELCIAYTDLLSVRDERRRELHEKFAFECHCTACSLSGAQLEASDGRRSRLRQLYQEIAGCGMNPALGIRKVKHALTLLKEEGLRGFLDQSYYYDAFQFCTSVSDIASAKAWARKAWEAECRNKGPDCPEAKKMENYSRDPRAHLSFGMLRKQRLGRPN